MGSKGKRRKHWQRRGEKEGSVKGVKWESNGDQRRSKDYRGRKRRMGARESRG